ncbi:MAG: sulfurtransferase TusA family protein [Burkholderiales bacterium]
MNFDKELDARGLNCPLATGPGAVKDFETFSRQTGHQLVSHGEANQEFTFFMRKK